MRQAAEVAVAHALFACHQFEQPVNAHGDPYPSMAPITAEESGVHTEEVHPKPSHNKGRVMLSGRGGVHVDPGQGDQYPDQNQCTYAQDQNQTAMPRGR